MACIRDILELAVSKETLIQQYYAHSSPRLGFPGAGDFFSLILGIVELWRKSLWKPEVMFDFERAVGNEGWRQNKVCGLLLISVFAELTFKTEYWVLIHPWSERVVSMSKRIRENGTKISSAQGAWGYTIHSAKAKARFGSQSESWGQRRCKERSSDIDCHVLLIHYCSFFAVLVLRNTNSMNKW